MKAPAPSLSLGGGLIYSTRCCTWDQIEHSPALHRGAFERVCVCVRESAGVWCTCECVERDGGRGGRRGEVGVGGAGGGGGGGGGGHVGVGWSRV
jgi:hypothetical protein